MMAWKVAIACAFLCLIGWIGGLITLNGCDAAA